MPSFGAEFLQNALAERRAEREGLSANAQIRELAIQFNSRRRVATTSIGMTSTWLDQDTSGTYNPRGGRLTPPAPKTKKPRVERSTNDGDNAAQQVKRIPVGYSYLMSFKFAGDTGKEYLKTITPGPYEPKPESGSDGGEFSDLLDDNDAPLPRRKLKRRRGLANAPMQRSDGRKIEDLTEGHPQIRGCKSCFLRSDDSCSLIDHPLDYPCAACEDAGSDCELIVPPKLKKACQNCQHEKIKCSYTLNGGKGVTKCDNCDEDEVPCIAGPLDEDSKYGRRFANIKSPSPPPDPYPRMCSLKNKTDKGPCGRCKKLGKECEFIECPPEMRLRAEREAEAKKAAEKAQKKKAKQAAKDAKRKRTKKGDTAVGKPSSSSNPILPLPRSVGLQKGKGLMIETSGTGKRAREKAFRLPTSPRLSATTDGIHHKIISTAFAHPIKFNHEPPKDGSDPCLFCKSPYFGLWGYGVNEVEVVPYGGSKGNIEVSGGHVAEQGTNSKMCSSCTYYRVRITTCLTHKIVPIENYDQRSFSAEELEKSLKAMNAGNSKEEGSLAMNTKWCSICTSVAEYQCSAPHRFSSKSFAKNPAAKLADTADPDFIGCGLYLCGKCHNTLDSIERSKSSTEQRKIVDILLKVRKDQLYKYPGDEIRADSEFLLEKGVMMTTLMAVKKEA
ncbi:hypothetical protein HYFRA_00000074 [Hymenoscyphus fraxineus]|uniref:Zn(2)-C6 fungal-type domain-containing protein n=1 Tax=Hymenoscyphus fraxineus TaxID=746836 RepID=A0A9N9L573_9HELO|nr:hypothetical protein HYFRA_00000074 [Hymenoscyphus fraxineus]